MTREEADKIAHEVVREEIEAEERIEAEARKNGTGLKV